MLTTQEQNIKRFYTNFMAYPQGWPFYPFCPVVRGNTSNLQNTEAYEVGVLFDTFHLHGYLWRIPGYSATVFKCNLKYLPHVVEDILMLPQETFDTIEEVLTAGWRPDLP